MIEGYDVIYLTLTKNIPKKQIDLLAITTEAIFLFRNILSSFKIFDGAPYYIEITKNPQLIFGMTLKPSEDLNIQNKFCAKYMQTFIQRNIFTISEDIAKEIVLENVT